ncbi:hypothetical protein EFA69_11355 [Rufibacter immobilis]|uniref:Copper chaperone PCu(A)C n=1 Tax=Rufibacter immobilis TaxID=1348778 RepID=A0A3M9MZA4_9BACT|nr:hypothetical protein [Rufibacter immobilis]RNI30098.1 hypothetical protein EFA69_11355 [Rufibacter immobilis]
MNRYRLFVFVFAAVLLCTDTLSPASAQTPQGHFLLTFKNGQTVSPLVGFTPEELKGDLMIKVAEGMEVLNIYHLRGERPLRAKAIQNQLELKTLNLAHWLAGKEGVAGLPDTVSAITKVDVRPGDRIAFQARYKGQDVSVTYPVR